MTEQRQLAVAFLADDQQVALIVDNIHRDDFVLVLNVHALHATCGALSCPHLRRPEADRQAFLRNEDYVLIFIGQHGTDQCIFVFQIEAAQATAVHVSQQRQVHSFDLPFLRCHHQVGVLQITRNRYDCVDFFAGLHVEAQVLNGSSARVS